LFSKKENKTAQVEPNSTAPNSAVNSQPQKENTTIKEIIREKEVIVKIRCSYCHSAYNETENNCPHCGAKN
jgi:hypothetical protein